MNYSIRLLHTEKNRLISVFKQWRRQIEVGKLLHEDDEYMKYIEEQQSLIMSQIFDVQQTIIKLERMIDNGTTDESNLGIGNRIYW